MKQKAFRSLLAYAMQNPPEQRAVSRLPDGYEELTYLSNSDGGNNTQKRAVINTMVIPTMQDEYILTAAELAQNGNNTQPLFASSKTKTDSNVALWICGKSNTNGGVAEFNFGSGDNVLKKTQWSGGLRGFHTYRMKMSTGEAWIDGTYAGQQTVKPVTGNAQPLHLFGSYRDNNNPKIHSTSQCAYKEFIILRNEEKIRHFIPCRRVADGALGMYDLCEYVNATEGIASPFYVSANTSSGNHPFWAGDPYPDSDAKFQCEVEALNDNEELSMTIAKKSNTWHWIDWGDGTVDYWTDHTYASKGKYIVRCNPDAEWINYDSSSTYFSITGLNPTRLYNLDVPKISPSFATGCSSMTIAPRALHEGLTRIGNSAFTNCSKLDFASLPSTLTAIGNSAFYKCDLSSLTALPSGLLSIGDSCFKQSNIAITEIPQGMLEIPSNAFQECTSIRSLSLPNGLTTIGKSAFNLAGNLSVPSMPSTLASIGYRAFAQCFALSGTLLLHSIDEIGYNAFQSNGYTYAEIHGTSNFTTLPTYAFGGSGSLLGIYIDAPALTTINSEALALCWKMKKIWLNAPNLETFSTDFARKGSSSHAKLDIYVPFSQSQCDFSTLTSLAQIEVHYNHVFGAFETGHFFDDPSQLGL